MAMKFRSLVVLLLLGAMLFGQTAPKKVLAAGDVDSFITNFSAMSAEFDALGNSYEDLIPPGAAEEDGISYSSLIAQVRATAVPSEVKAILKKYGLGENGFEKIMVITLGCTALEMDRIVTLQSSDPSVPQEMKGYFDGAKSQIAEMKSAIHPDDLALIKSKLATIIELLEIDSN